MTITSITDSLSNLKELKTVPEIEGLEKDDYIWFAIDDRNIRLLGKPIFNNKNEQIRIEYPEDFLVQGDNYSRTFCFVLQRYYEDIDLSTCTAKLHFNLPESGQMYYPQAENLIIHSLENVCYFICKLPQQISLIPGEISFSVCIYKNSTRIRTKSYIFNVPATTIASGESDIEEPELDWKENIEAKVTELESNKQDVLIKGDGISLEDENISVDTTIIPTRKDVKGFLPGLYNSEGIMLKTWEDIKQEYPDAFYKGGTEILSNPNNSYTSYFKELEGKLVIGNEIVYISIGAFRECSLLTNIIIPDSVTKISGNAFVDCSTLSEIVLSNNIKIIENYIFSGCTNLTEIKIPIGVTEIKAGAFYGCTNLSKVTIPNTVKIINTEVFYNCEKLTDIYYNGSINIWNVISQELDLNMEQITIHPLYTIYSTDGLIIYENYKDETNIPEITIGIDPESSLAEIISNYDQLSGKVSELEDKIQTLEEQLKGGTTE